MNGFLKMLACLIEMKISKLRGMQGLYSLYSLLNRRIKTAVYIFIDKKISDSSIFLWQKKSLLNEVFDRFKIVEGKY